MMVLKTLDDASAPFISYPQMVTVLADTAEAGDCTEAEKEHLHALGAAMFFTHQSDGTWLGSYRGAGPDSWACSPDQLPPGVHAVWTAYADTTAHPAVLARLHHLLWTVRHGDRPITHLQAAITNYRHAASVLLAADTGSHPLISRWQAVDALCTAYDLAAAFRQPQITDIITEMLDVADAALSWPEPAHGVINAMTEPLLGDKKNHPQLHSLLQRAVDHCHDGSPDQVEILKDLRQTEPDPDAQRRIDERIIAALISQAEEQEGLAKLVHLEQAATFARDHGLTNALDQLRRIQQKLNPEDLGLTRVTTPVNLPRIFIDTARAAIDATDSLDQALQTIALTLPVIVDPVDADQHGLIRLPTLRLNLNGPLVTNTSDSSLAGQDLINARIFSMDFHGIRIEAQLDQLKKRFTPTTDQLLTALTDPPLAPASRMRGLARALHAFWEQDDDTAIALTLPRVEGLLRRRLQEADIAVIQHAQGSTPGQVSQLGSLIGKMKDAGYPEPWPTAFRALLGGPTDGINLRNGVLHDLVDTPPRPRIALALQAALTVLFLPLPDSPAST